MAANPFLNETHDPALRSWVEGSGEGDFPIQNLPFASFRRARSNEAFRCGVAIGDRVVDLGAVAARKLFPGAAGAAALAGSQPRLNALMSLGPEAWSGLRLALSRGLREGSSMQAVLSDCLVPQAEVLFGLPASIGDYTDFYTSIHHATSVGALFRPDAPLLPNYKWVPIGYHGRSSSIEVSGQRFARPWGQLKRPDEDAPVLAPSARLDYELELGIFVGVGNALGERVDISRAEANAFGVVLLNDWSARDIQAWEYQPLGPFLSKSFATTISPWVVSFEALAPYRTAWQRSLDDAQPLPYLEPGAARAWAAFDICLDAFLETAAVRAAGLAPLELASSNFRHAYWTIGQMIAHHTSNGCGLQPGDLLGTGTQSGPLAGEAGSLLELSRGGKQPFALANGETRSFLLDGDAVIFRARCERKGFASIGFGECRGEVAPAVPVAS